MSGFGSFMDGAMKGALFYGRAEEAKLKNKATKSAQAEEARIAKVNEEETARQLAALGPAPGAAPAAPGPTPIADSGAAAPAGVPTQAAPTEETPINGLAETAKGVLGKLVTGGVQTKDELPSDRKYDPDQLANKTEPTPTQAMPEKGETTQQLKEQDGSMSQPAGEPKLSTKELKTNPDAYVTSDNTPSLLQDQNSRMRFALKSLGKGATAAERKEAMNAVSQETRTVAMKELSRVSSVISAAKNMPEGPDKIAAMNAVKANIAQIWDILPNGMSARVERIPAAEGASEKWVLQQYSSKNPEVSLGPYFLSEDSINGLIDQFGGVDGAENWDDYSPEMKKSLLEVQKKEQEFEQEEVKMTIDTINTATQNQLALMSEQRLQNAQDIDLYKELNKASYGGYASAEAQTKGVKTWRDWVKNTVTEPMQKLNALGNSAATGQMPAQLVAAQTAALIAQIRGDKNAVIPEGNDTALPINTGYLSGTGVKGYDAFYKSPRYSLAMAEAEAQVRNDPSLNHRDAFERQMFKDQALRYADQTWLKEAKDKGIDPASEEGAKLRSENRGKVISQKDGYTTISVPDGKGGLKQVRQYATPIQNQPISKQKAAIVAPFGTKSKMMDLGFKTVTIKLPNGDSVVMLAPSGTTMAGTKNQVKEQRQMEKQAKVQGTTSRAPEVPGGLPEPGRNIAAKAAVEDTTRLDPAPAPAAGPAPAAVPAPAGIPEVGAAVAPQQAQAGVPAATPAPAQPMDPYITAVAREANKDLDRGGMTEKEARTYMATIEEMRRNGVDVERNRALMSLITRIQQSGLVGMR